MSDKKRLERAKQLRKEADQLEKEAVRNLPDKWEVGMRVRYLRSEDWTWSKGSEGIVNSLREECADRKGYEYQVFYTSPLSAKDGSPTWWTTPDDVEFISNNELEGKS